MRDEVPRRQPLLTATSAKRALKEKASAERARTNAWFFKTDPGSYGAHDRFLGITVPEVRKVARAYARLPLPELRTLLRSAYNEERLLALIVMVDRFGKADERERRAVFDLYMKERAHVDNWNLVDASARAIVGEHLVGRDRSLLYRLARSRSLWERRIAIVAAWAFILRGDLDDIFALGELVMDDEEDLMHKALGWMLREAGKKDVRALESYLRANIGSMPRTTLRYAIERFPEAKRKRYLALRPAGPPSVAAPVPATQPVVQQSWRE